MGLPAYDIGSLVKISSSFADDSGAPVDPTLVQLTLVSPTGTTTYGPGTGVIHDSLGNYHVSVTADTSGTWSYKWVATGTGQSAKQGAYNVLPDATAVSPPANIVTPSWAGTWDVSTAYHINNEVRYSLGSSPGTYIALKPSTGVTPGTDSATWQIIALDGALSFPSQTGNNGKFLTTNGTATSWSSVSVLPDQSGQSGKFLETNGSVVSWGTAGGIDLNGGINFNKNLPHTITVATQDDGLSGKQLQIIALAYVGGQAPIFVISGGDSLGPGAFRGGHISLQGGAGVGGQTRGGIDVGGSNTNDVFLGGSIASPGSGAVINFEGEVTTPIYFGSAMGSSAAISSLQPTGTFGGNSCRVSGSIGGTTGGKGGQGIVIGGGAGPGGYAGGDAVVSGGDASVGVAAFNVGGSVTIDGGVGQNGNSNGGIYIGGNREPANIIIGFGTSTVIGLTGPSTFSSHILFNADKTSHIGTSAKMPTQVFSYQHAGQLQTLTGSGAVTAFDPTQGETIQFTETANVTSLTLTVGQIGQIVTLKLVQSSNTGHTWTTTIVNCKLAGGTFTKTTTANAVDTITLRCDGTNWYEIGRALALS